MGTENDKIVMVYDLQTLGGKDTYNTLSGINTLFKEIAANKTSLNGVFNINFDMSKLESMNKGFAQIVASNKELIVYIKNLTTEISKMGQVGQQTTTAMATSMGKVNMATLQNITGFQQFQQVVNASALTAENYGAMVTMLQLKMSELSAAIRDNAEAAVELRQKYNQGTITEEEYNAGIQQISASQFELKAALGATGKELSTLNALWNGTAESAAGANQQIQANKVALSEHNIELKQLAKLAMAAEGSVDQLAVRLGLLRDKYRQLTAAERESVTGRQMLIDIQKLDAEVKTLDKSIGNSQRNVGNYGSAFDKVGAKVEQFVVRDLFRATAGFIVFNLLFESATKLWDAIPSKVDKSTEAMDGFNQTLTKQLDEFIQLQKAINDYFNIGENTFKRQVESIRAKGVVNGEVFKAEQEAFDAEQQLREKQLSDLGQVADKYRQVNDIFLQYDKTGDLNGARVRLKALGLAPEDLKGLNKQINEYLVARSKLDEKDKKDFKLAENTDLVKKQSALQDEQYAKEQEIENAKTQLHAKQEELRYNKNIELAANLVQIKEQRRQEAEREDINSVDKITKDVTAKYKIMYDEILKKKLELAKQFPDDKLPADLEQKYNTILANVRKIEELDKKNQVTAFNRAERLSSIGFNAVEAQSGADITKFFADNGSINYGGMADAIDKQQEAKVKGEEKNYEESKEQYRLHNRSTEELDQQHQDRLHQIELEGYEKRTSLAAQYYDRIRDQIVAANDLAIEKIQTQTLNKVIGILGGRGSMANRNAEATKAQQYGIIEAAQKNIEAQEKLLEKAKAVAGNDMAAYNLAPTDDKRKIAGDQLAQSQRKVADIDASIAQSRKDIVDAQNALQDQNRKLNETIRNESINAFQEIGNAYIQMLQAQEAARERYSQMALEWNKKQLDSQVQSNQQKQANDRAYFIATQQMERERFNQQKKLAKDQMAVDYASAVMKIVASNAGLGLAAPAVDAVEIAGVTAIYFAKLAMMNEQQYGEGGEVPSNGGMFGGRSHTAGGTPFFFQNRSFEAEAGELAIVNKRSAASNQVMTVTGTPKQIASGINAFGGGYNFAPGARVYKYEWGGSLGAQIAPPTFVSDYYTRKMQGDYQGADMYNMILSQNAVLQEHAAAIGRESNRAVVLNPHHVTNFQKQHEKSTQIGTL